MLNTACCNFDGDNLSPIPWRGKLMTKLVGCPRSLDGRAFIVFEAFAVEAAFLK